jgi:hypothetical protein
MVQVTGVLMVGGATLRINNSVAGGPTLIFQKSKEAKSTFALPIGAKAAYKWIEDHLAEEDQPAGNAIVDFYVDVARRSRS